MGHSAGGLSDVLREMAQREAARKKPASASAPLSPPAPAKVKAPRRASTETPSRPAAPGAAAPTRPRRSAAPAASRPAGTARHRAPQSTAPAKVDPLYAAAVPVCLTVAALLMVPGVWAVLILLEVDVWRSDWQGAGTMALAMLACFPIAVLLIAGAWYFHTTGAVARPVRVPPRRS